MSVESMASIRVLNLRDAEKYEPDEGEVCISITSPRTSAADLQPGWHDVLELQFSDVSDGMPIGTLAIPFDIDHAKEIVAFVRANRGRPIVVHCEAGISRSAGVALALHEFLEGRYPPAPLEEHYRLHNRLVRRLILKAADLSP